MFNPFPCPCPCACPPVKLARRTCSDAAYALTKSLLPLARRLLSEVGADVDINPSLIISAARAPAVRPLPVLLVGAKDLTFSPNAVPKGFSAATGCDCDCDTVTAPTYGVTLAQLALALWCWLIAHGALELEGIPIPILAVPCVLIDVKPAVSCEAVVA